MKNAKEIVDFWYDADIRKHWFKATPEFDQQLTSLSSLFKSSWQRALEGEYDGWMDSATGCLALCILLDQIPRNIFRGSPKSFSSDDKALMVCKHAIETGLHKSLSSNESRFLYMPLMHSEVLADQDLSIQMFAEAELEEQSRFAHHHRDIIEKFGRFPHRNEKLGRVSTEPELEYLESKSAFKG